MKKSSSLTLVAIFTALFLPLAAVVLAPDAEGQPAKTSVEEARSRMDKGQALFGQGKYAEAATEFEAAHAAQPYSAFLYNAALAAEKGGDPKRAALHYTEFLSAEPNAPDQAEIRANINKLQQLVAAQAAAAAAADGGADQDGGAPAAPPVPVVTPATNLQMRSLVLVESDPPGAPFSIYQQTTPGAPAFKATGENPGWKAIATNVKTPKDLSLNIGKYHVVIDAFKDYHRSETDIDLDPGHVYNFKANLSQGAFLGFLKVSSKVEGAKIFLDDPPPHKKAPWGRTPGGGLLEDGEHTIWIEAPGYESITKKVSIAHGETVDVPADLQRVSYGYLKLDGNAEEVFVSIDGAESGTFKPGNPPLRLKLPAGTHTLVMDASGKKKYKGEISVPKGQEMGVHAAFIDTYPKSRAIVTGILGVGAGVGGYIFLNQSDSLPEGDDKKGLYKGFAYGGFIGGGVLVAASVFLFIYDPTPDSLVKTDKANEFPEGEATAFVRPRVKQIAPIAVTNGGGLLLKGVF